MKKIICLLSCIWIVNSALAGVWVDSAGKAVVDQAGSDRVTRGTTSSAVSYEGVDVDNIIIVDDAVNAVSTDLAHLFNGQDQIEATCSMPAVSTPIYLCRTGVTNCNQNNAVTWVNWNTRWGSAGAATAYGQPVRFGSNEYIKENWAGFNPGLTFKGASSNRQLAYTPNAYPGAFWDGVSPNVGLVAYPKATSNTWLSTQKFKVVFHKLYGYSGYLDSTLLFEKVTDLSTVSGLLKNYSGEINTSRDVLHYPIFEIPIATISNAFADKPNYKYLTSTNKGSTEIILPGQTLKLGSGRLNKSLAVRNIEHVFVADKATATIKIDVERALFKKAGQSQLTSFYSNAVVSEKPILHVSATGMCNSYGCGYSNATILNQSAPSSNVPNPTTIPFRYQANCTFLAN